MQKISIKNIGPIQEVHEIVLPGITVLLGEQATGKSTLAQCVHFFRSLPEDFANESFNLPQNKSVKDVREMLENTVRSKFYIYYGGSSRLDDFEITFWYETNRSISIYKSEKTRVEFSGEFGIDKLSKEVVKCLDMYFPKPSDRANYLKMLFRSHIFGLEGELQSRFSEEMYFPATRHIVTMFSEQFRDFFINNFVSVSLLAGQNKPNSVNIQLMQQFVQWCNRMKEEVEFRGGNFNELFTGRPHQIRRLQFLERAQKILKATYFIDKRKREELLKLGGGKHVQLDKASSGQQSVLRIIQDLALIIADNVFTSRTIEEPEVHLFPDAQQKLAELIVMCHLLTGSEFILTTHSPYFVAMFNNMLYAAKAAVFEPDEVTEIGYPEHFRLPLKNFSAYLLENGNATSIYNPNEGLTSIDGLDAVSLEIGAKFGALADIINEHETFA